MPNGLRLPNNNIIVLEPEIEQKQAKIVWSTFAWLAIITRKRKPLSKHFQQRN